MKVLIFFTLLVAARGDYPAAVPEIVAPSDSYGPPPEVPADVYAPPAAPSDSYGAPVKAPVDSYAPPPAPSDSYGAPVKAPVDSYAPPTKAAPVKAPLPLPEVLPAPVPETVVAEPAAPVAANSASFNFLSELATPSVVAIAVPEASLKAEPVVSQEAVTVPVAQELQINIPGLIPPISNSPLPSVIPPIQLPPVVLPPVQAPVPAPVPVQPIPVPPVAAPSVPAPAPVPVALQSVPTPPITLPPVSVPSTPSVPSVPSIPSPPVSIPSLPIPQTLPLETKTVSVPAPQFTQYTTQIQHIPVQRAFFPQHYFVPTLASYSYAPHFYQAQSLPTALLTQAKLAPQIETSAQALPELVSLVQEPVTAVVKASPTIRAPATSYGTPAFEALNKKK